MNSFEEEIKRHNELTKVNIYKSFNGTEDIEKAEKKEDSEEEKVDKFKHHRLMAGYHALMSQKSGDDSLKLNSSSDEEIRKNAKLKEGEGARHKKMMEEHMNRAKSMHDEEKHGEWNTTIPSSKQAREYGSKHAAAVDKKKPSDKAFKEQKEVKTEKAEANDIEKSILDSLDKNFADLEKGGEGNKGGKVIGHTKSGKPIYEDRGHESHKKFTSKDHKDAAAIHEHLSKHSDSKDGKVDKMKHMLAKEHHEFQANKKDKESKTDHNQKMNDKLNEKVGVKKTDTKNTEKKDDKKD